jgi:hypothetical protein
MTTNEMKAAEDYLKAEKARLASRQDKVDHYRKHDRHLGKFFPDLCPKCKVSNPPKLWMIFRENGGPPKVKYYDYKVAMADARHLAAMNPTADFLVLKIRTLVNSASLAEHNAKKRFGLKPEGGPKCPDFPKNVGENWTHPMTPKKADLWAIENLCVTKPVEIEQRHLTQKYDVGTPLTIFDRAQMKVINGVVVSDKDDTPEQSVLDSIETMLREEWL